MFADNENGQSFFCPHTASHAISYGRVNKRETLSGPASTINNLGRFTMLSALRAPGYIFSGLDLGLWWVYHNNLFDTTELYFYFPDCTGVIGSP